MLVTFIKIQGKTLTGFLIERSNRFLALVDVEKKVLPCFLPNPGRMHELLIPGVEVILREENKQNRKTFYDIIGVVNNDEIVSVDTRVPNKLVFEALKNGDIEELSEYNDIKPEYSYGNSRFDFLLMNGNKCLLEVKSCTLVRDEIALFPDAPTVRGRRHLKELVKAKKEGYRACIIFIIQRKNAKLFCTNDETDPEFGKTLRYGLSNGIEAFAYYSEFDGKRIDLKGKIKIDLKKAKLSNN
jgi:sugar fermentation stimulation protein A